MSGEAYSVYSGTIDGYGAGGYNTLTYSMTNSKGGYARFYNTETTRTITLAAGTVYTNSKQTITIKDTINYQVQPFLDSTCNMYLSQTTDEKGQETTQLTLYTKGNDGYILENKEPLQAYRRGTGQTRNPSEEVYIGQVTVVDKLITKIKKAPLNYNSAIGDVTTNGVMPDYSAGVDISESTIVNGFTAPIDGVIYHSGSGDADFTINGFIVGSTYHSNYANYQPVSFYLSGGDLFKKSQNSSEFKSCIFFPMKGANNA